MALAFGLSACNGCDKKEAERHKHNYISTVTEPTCTVKGYTIYNCECGNSYVNDYTEPLGHDYARDVCSRCGWIRHDHVYTVTTVGPDCFNGGYSRGVCDICGATYTVNYDALGHDCENGKCRRCDYFNPDEHGHEYEESIVDPDCTNQGYTTFTCWCGYSYKGNYTEPTHDFDNGKCTRCGFFDLDKHEHVYKKTTVEPDCTHQGYTTFTCWCGYSYDGNYTDPVGHDYDNGTCTRCNEPEPDKELKYTLSDNGEYYICTGIGTVTDTDIVIAQEYNGKPVKEIGNYAFQNCSIVSVCIPEGLTSIGRGAFYRCTELKEIFIPQSVTAIGDLAFYRCSSLYSITLPDGLTSIGRGAFFYCPELKEIYIPQSVTTIGDLAFYRCSSLYSITLPDNLTSIGRAAFYHCNMLTKINLPAGLVEITGDAFRMCTSLTSITIPESVTYIGSNVFYGCTDLTIFCEAKEQPDEWDGTWSGDCTVIWDCKNSGQENGLEYILSDNGEYYICTGIGKVTDIDIVVAEEYNGKPVKEIGSSAFSSCPIVSVYIPEGVTVIGSGAFDHCTDLMEIYIPQTVTAIGDYAFFGCGMLYRVTLPEKLTSIGKYAFSWCERLKSIFIPRSVTTIGSHAFGYCDNLTVYCEVASRPSGWSVAWNGDDETCPVVWDSKNNS